MISQTCLIELELHDKLQVKWADLSWPGVEEVKTMISQTCLLELELYDKVQVKQAWRVVKLRPWSLVTHVCFLQL
jgi:hypothetical protein